MERPCTCGCDADGRISLESAAIVETGQLKIQDGADNIGLVGTLSGSLIGMLVGVLGGPVGVLVGFGAGALMGGAYDIARADTSDDGAHRAQQAIPSGSTAVIAEVEERAADRKHTGDRMRERGRLASSSSCATSLGGGYHLG